MEKQQSQLPATELWWIVANIAISCAILFIIPFPFSLFATVGLFIFIAFKISKKRTGHSAIGGSPMTVSLKIECLYCGTPHRDISCPDCGSKVKKVRFA